MENAILNFKIKREQQEAIDHAAYLHISLKSDTSVDVFVDTVIYIYTDICRYTAMYKCKCRYCKKRQNEVLKG